MKDVVTICGSTRFREAMAMVNRDLTLQGKVVLAPGVFAHWGDSITEEQKTALDKLHLRKIDMAEEVVVVNVGGYIGDSTRAEVDYALSAGKRVTFTDGRGEWA